MLILRRFLIGVHLSPNDLRFRPRLSGIYVPFALEISLFIAW